jgi:MSHA biogenesis protein MshQ
VNVIDTDGVAYAGNPARFGQPTAGNGIAWTAGKSIRTGRLQLTNANGSELVALAVPFVAQYWNGSVFVANASDACTAALVAELGLAPNPGGLSTTPTIANNPLAAGSAGLVLSAPGAGNTGYVDLVYDLSTVTGAALEFLRWDWDGDGSLDDDPTARATFGIFPGDARVIYLREVY